MLVRFVLCLWFPSPTNATGIIVSQNLYSILALIQTGERYNSPIETDHSCDRGGKSRDNYSCSTTSCFYLEGETSTITSLVETNHMIEADTKRWRSLPQRAVRTAEKQSFYLLASFVLKCIWISRDFLEKLLSLPC